MDATNTSITGQIENFLSAAKKIEDSLTEEKKRSQKIAQEYVATRTKLETVVKDLQARIAQREGQIAAATLQLRDVTAREATASSELSQYKKAWQEVLARDTQARNLMAEHEKAKRILVDQKNRISTLEKSVNEKNELAATHSRRAETYQRELHTAQLRLQNTETKLNEVMKELAALKANQRTVEKESSRIRAAMEEKYRKEFAIAKERMYSNLQQEAKAEKERILTQARRESERTVSVEREARFALEVGLEQTKKKLEEAEGFRKEAAMLRMELNRRSAELETVKKDSTKSLLMERLKFEAAMNEMREKIDALMTTGLYAEKISAAPAGVSVVTAHPVEGTPSVNSRSFSGASANPSA